jgi:hypothetical protein
LILHSALSLGWRKSQPLDLGLEQVMAVCSDLHAGLKLNLSKVRLHKSAQIHTLGLQVLSLHCLLNRISPKNLNSLFGETDWSHPRDS